MAREAAASSSLQNEAPPKDVLAPSPGDKPASLPEQIGRYRVERMLGEGGFGVVHLACDEQLKRRVAVKVPHPGRIADLHDAEAFLTEARIVAGLDHLGIAPVYDVGSVDNCPCYVVSRYIEGSSLSPRMYDGRPNFHEAADRNGVNVQRGGSDGTLQPARSTARRSV